MTNTFDEIAARAEERQRDLRREAEVGRLTSRRTLESGRTLRIVLPSLSWPRLQASHAPCLEA